jgi:8-oxo-dGTP pyrophosphatase MutT (NUDIX family)
MKIVKESLKEDDIQYSAGIVIIWNNKILLGHATNRRWDINSYSFPKGHLESSEAPIDAAIRETQEEVGVTIKQDQIEPNEMGTIEYKDKKGNIYKIVYYFVCYLEEEIHINKKDLQMEEIDYAGFFSKEEAEKKIFWRLKPVLKYLK